MGAEFRIALVSNNARVTHDVENILGREVTKLKGDKLNLKTFASAPSMEDTIQYGPMLIVVHIDPAQQSEGTAFLDHLSRISDRIPVVVCASELPAELMLSCVKKGVRDFLKYPLQELEIREMLERVARETATVTEAQRAGITHTFFSYKGGLGTTFLACNTAVAIARLTRSRVLLWDLVVQNGDVPFFFDYEPTSTVSDLLENSSSIDELYLKATLPMHSSGVCILAGPKRPEEAEAIRNDQLQGLHQTLRKFYDFIIIDGGHALTDQIISAMDHSKYVMLITDLHLPVLKNTLRCLEVFERLGYSAEKFKLLLNRYNSKYQKFDLAKAEEILRYPVSYTFANDYVMVSRSLNTGIPVAELDEESILANQFETLGRLLLNEFKIEEKKSFSLFGPLKEMFGGRRQKPEKRKQGKKDKKDKKDEQASDKDKQDVKKKGEIHAA